MPSVNKTTNLGLNQWAGNEYPKRLDFVEDNATIDGAVGKLANLVTTDKTNLVAAVNEVKEQNNSLGALKNKIINGDFTVNQRVASAKAQSVGVYGYDRWKGHANGLEQVIEALPAETYTLSWLGGGTGTFGGTTAVSPITATVTAGNTSVIVPATAIKVQLETGLKATAYEERPIGLELLLCQRYFEKTWNVDVAPGTATEIGSIIEFAVRPSAGQMSGTIFKVSKRTTPTVKIYSTSGAIDKIANSGDKSAEAVLVGLNGFGVINITSGVSNANAYYHYTADAEI
jgi:hypothetical protein